jgi:hypothetical protein
VNGNAILLGVFGEFYSTSEGNAMMNMKRATIALGWEYNRARSI